MDLSSIPNKQIGAAIDALQKNDIDTWFSYFSKDVVFTDDGNTLHFRSFFENAFAKKEKFLQIEKVENEGKDIYGIFYAGQWGSFRVYFKFRLNAEGKINRLDIGQVK